ncbi:hypothetical protein K504DRAFT_505902 [Pleomassaria siparia CBS 279.74]|uniref:Uncharacterized protein n=1 Tax=Pleomassaria siparia CBS 279.74 TaxID=1314801 RepID=A0A6G1JZ03_9PLEO|nr:hypothetical protein K504DRAFT_505902 [Pleomassaria siparia CBS 279.74]
MVLALRCGLSPNADPDPDPDWTPMTAFEASCDPVLDEDSGALYKESAQGFGSEGANHATTVGPFLCLVLGGDGSDAGDGRTRWVIISRLVSRVWLSPRRPSTNHCETPSYSIVSIVRLTQLRLPSNSFPALEWLGPLYYGPPRNLKASEACVTATGTSKEGDKMHSLRLTFLVTRYPFHEPALVIGLDKYDVGIDGQGTDGKRKSLPPVPPQPSINPIPIRHCLVWAAKYRYVDPGPSHSNSCAQRVEQSEPLLDSPPDIRAFAHSRIQPKMAHTLTIKFKQHSSSIHSESKRPKISPLSTRIPQPHPRPAPLSILREKPVAQDPAATRIPLDNSPSESF